MKKYSMKAAKRDKVAYRTPSAFRGRFVREKFLFQRRLRNAQNGRIKM